jgi:type I restriction enzyme M protein
VNLIAGDGQANIRHLNTLDYKMWDEGRTMADTYFEGWRKLKRLLKNPKNQFFGG